MRAFSTLTVKCQISSTTCFCFYGACFQLLWNCKLECFLIFIFREWKAKRWCHSVIHNIFLRFYFLWQKWFGQLLLNDDQFKGWGQRHLFSFLSHYINGSYPFNRFSFSTSAKINQECNFILILQLDVAKYQTQFSLLTKHPEASKHNESWKFYQNIFSVYAGWYLNYNF